LSFEDISATSLWRDAFAPRGIASEDAARTRLHGELQSFRSRANDLVSLIHTSLPDLTIHDVTHLDALWKVASLLAGEEFPLNALEAFVLGGAILLHDAALCIEAYEGGLAGIRATTTWQDTYAIERERDQAAAQGIVETRCDFLSMRALHAHRAGELARHAWRTPIDGSELFLIGDPTLRNHVGGLIGEIASSHHWSIEKVWDKLARQLNAPAGYPPEWVIDAVKVACLLRTADAAHFSQDRAPDFLHALRRRSGVSGDHWNAQNRVTGPALSTSDPAGKTITYTSTQDFRESDFRAWWVAYDALSVVQREIESVNQLLASRPSSKSLNLKISTVAGANSVGKLSRFVRASGWEPCDVNIHISDVESLVRNLGGEKLYGATTKSEKLYVVVRELIQNARDSIVALRSIEADFIGGIVIRLIKEGSSQWIQIEDDGVGMSRRVLTGSLLDFGNSFWSSDLVKTELPGLRANGYRPIGRFGIGFYSVFMIAADVSVSSRRWNCGDNDTLQLIFPDGLSMRPIVKQGRPSSHHRLKSTTIRLKLREDCYIEDEHAMPIQVGFAGIPSFVAPLGNLIASWIAALEVPVTFVDSAGHSTQVHGGKPGLDPSAEMLLRQSSLSEFRGDYRTTLGQNITALSQRMRPVGDLRYGYAAIQDTPANGTAVGGIRSIGGLGQNTVGGDPAFVGYIDCQPDSARRGPQNFTAPDEIISNWAAEQVELFEAASPTDFQRAIFGNSLCMFGFDPISVARLLVLTDAGLEFVSFDALAARAAQMPILFPESAFGGAADTYAEVIAIPGAIVVKPLMNGPFSSLAMENDLPKEKNSVVGCLYRAIEKSGGHPKLLPSSTIFKSAFGVAKSIAVGSTR
jgi:hypothetical protein